MTRTRRFAWLAVCVLVCAAAGADAQGVTSGSIKGTVTDPQDRPVPGATITAVHEPSGSRWEAVSRADGRFTVPGLRVGGPYAVTAALAGFRPSSQRGVTVALGVSTDLTLRLGDVAAAEEVTVTAQSPDVFSSARTGAATTVARQVLATLPTINDRLNDYARLTPQYVGAATVGAYAGADSRLNNITVDGAGFNASLGLVGQLGDVTGVAPITTEALEQIQVNVAPYDVRHGNFVGAGVNSVTRSGGNEFRGSAYYKFRDQGLVGREAAGLAIDPGAFDFKRWGGWASGPVIRDRVSFFLSYEGETLKSPGTTFRARAEGETAQGNTTRVRASDLDALSGYLSSRFDYDSGPYQGYTHETPATRYLAKLNYNLGDRNKVSLRYVHLDSSTDALLSNASLLGFGNRRGTNGLNFQNSNYQVLENIRSAVAEWTSIHGPNRANSLVIGYTRSDESRALRGELFPMVDILEEGTVYTTFGSEPFTPGNERRYATFQAQDDFTWSRGSHALALGASAERFDLDNVFFPGSQGIYVYNSLANFYTDADDYLANPGRTVSPVTLRRFQVRWSNIPGLEDPLQRLGLWYTGVYAQDEWQAGPRLKLTYGLRVDVPFFDHTGFRNAEADALTFRDRHGRPVRYQTDEFPAANLLWSPRVGFNWSADRGRRTQVRGGTGVFTSRPAYIWMSTQVGGTGVLTGFAQLENTRVRPFNPSPDAYKPVEVNGAPPSSYELTLADPRFRFPQVWRSNLAVDRKLPSGIIGTLEGIYTRDVNGLQFINANLPEAQTRLVGADERPRWTRNRIHPNITSALVLVNQDRGYAWNLAVSVAKSHRAGFLRAAYSRGDSRSPAEPGGTASSWASNPHSGDPNNPGAEFFARSQRAFLASSHRVDYLKRGATTVSFFFEGRNDGRASYTYAGDLNGDGGTANDLIYVPRDTSEMNFQPFTSGSRTFTPAEQAAAWEAYIAQDGYLGKRRGRYAERNGFMLPMVWRLDLSVAQELFTRLGRRRHALELRADVLNFTNLLDSGWGVGRRLVSAQPLTNAGVDAQGQAIYRLRAVNNRLITSSLEPTTSPFDVYRIQFSLKYSFE